MTAGLGKDLTGLEWGYLLPMVFLAFWMGIYPMSFLSRMEPSVNHWITQVQERAPRNMRARALSTRYALTMLGVFASYALATAFVGAARL